MTGLPDYPDCVIQREPPSANLDKDVAELVGKDFNVLPLFEKFLFEHKYKKYYSLQTNKFLHCRWRSYLEHYDERQFAPFTFVDRRDVHFYNGMNRIIPSESFHKKTDFPFKLKEGPGVDFGGQLPIPQNLLMKRETAKPTAKGRSHSAKALKDDQNQTEDKKK